MRLVYSFLALLVRALVHSPFYPHWLVNLKTDQAHKKVLHHLKGTILEVGAGDGARKVELLKQHPHIKKYVATDFSSWDSEFEKINTGVKRFGHLIEIFYGFKARHKLDVVCDAMKLPFPKNTFDYHLSFEVLEHISDPFVFIAEASRVLKKNGRIILSVPFLYRIHGGEPLHKWDYFRYAPGFFYEVAERNKLKVIDIYANAGVGTSVAQMLNQWLILKIQEAGIFKFVILPFAPIFFCFFNLFGYLLDIVPDKRFPTRLFITLEK